MELDITFLFTKGIYFLLAFQFYDGIADFIHHMQITGCRNCKGLSSIEECLEETKVAIGDSSKPKCAAFEADMRF